MVSDAGDRLEVRVEHLGGIDELEATFEPGVTLLVGRNATNRTSLLRSIAAALGGSSGRLKRTADAGRVELRIGDETATREFERDGDRVRVDGEPYTERGELVDDFATLLETNPARRAVAQADGDALREVVLDPIDTEELHERIDETRRELRSVDQRIEEIERRESNLPALEERRSQCAAELADVEAELESVADRLADLEPDADSDSDESTGGRADDGGGAAAADHADGDAEDSGEDPVDELREARQEYERVRDDRATQHDAIESLESELETIDDELAELDVPDADVDELEAELDDLRRRRRSLAATVSNLESIVEFNEELLDGADELPIGDAGAAPVGDADVSPVDALDPASQAVECWTCGTTVERAAIDDRLDDLRAVIEERREERASFDDEIEDLEATLSTVRKHRERIEALRERGERVQEELADRREREAELAAREAELRERVDDLAAAAEEADDAEPERIEALRRRSELEYERGQLEAELERLDGEIADVEALASEREELEARRDRLADELASLRGRIEAIESDAVDTFNERIATVLDLLEYENVERVWLERKVDSPDDSGSLERDREAATFDLHVVRADADGVVYEDSVDHLSESEREVVGLVVALAGYLVHDVHETVPVLLLDSLEAVDADRIARLVDYFSDVAPYLLVALLPGDARALPDEYDRVEMPRDRAATDGAGE